MKRSVIGTMLTRWATRAAVPLRGRVHKVSVVRGGEVSVVVRFGIDEPHARQLNQGALLELAVVKEADQPKVRKQYEPPIVEGGKQPGET